MARKKQSNKFKRDLQNTFLFISLIILAYLLGAHQEKVQSFYHRVAPEIQNHIADKAPALKDATQRGLTRIGNFTSRGTDKAKFTFDHFRKFPQKDSNNTYRENLDSRAISAKGQLKISSFNVRILSDKSRDDQELKIIAQIFKKYDLIAIQELRDEVVLQRLVKILKNMGYTYNYEVSPKVGKAIKEIYAFFYRQDKVTVTQRGKLYTDVIDKFIREPYYASFRSGNFDFTLVTIHALFGNNENERRPEIQELATVYKHIQDENPREQDIIILGDFNFPPTDYGFNELKTYPTMGPLILPSAKTTITDTSLYDNFWFQRQFVREYTGMVGIDKFDETIFHNDDNRAKIAVSDHRPIWASFNVEQADDD